MVSNVGKYPKPNMEKPFWLKVISSILPSHTEWMRPKLTFEAIVALVLLLNEALCQAIGIINKSAFKDVIPLT